MDFGRIGRLRCDGLRDVVENLLKFFCIGRRLVVVGVFRACAKLVARIRRGIGIITRHGVHKLVDVACPLFRGIGSGVRSTKDADGINGGLAVLHVLGSRHGSIGDARIKLAVARWLAVGKEHNDLLGACTTGRNIPSQFQTIVGARCTSGCNLGNPILKSFHVAAGAIGQALHYLRVVVPKLPLPVRVIADLISLITRKLNNGNPMLPINALDSLVLFGDGIDKAVRSALQCIDTLGGISATHRIIHRAGGIQHHHDVERRGDCHG